MATAEEDIEILIADDPNAKDDLTGADADATGKVEGAEGRKVVEPEEGIEQLKANLAKAEEVAAAERQAREAAERREAAARSQANLAGKAQQDTELALIVGAIDSLKQSQDVLKGNYAAAMQAGDYNEAADIQVKMSDASAKLLQLETGRAGLEAEAKNPRREEERPDPVEFVARQLTPQSAAWIRAHPEYARDKTNYDKVVRADAKVWGSGIERDSPAYFEAVERELGLRQADESPRQQQQQRREAAPPAAPGSRQPSEENGQRRRTMTLTPQQAEMADMMGMSRQEYATHLNALQAEGKIH